MTTADGSQAAPASPTATPYAGPASFQLDAGGSAVSISHKTMWGLATVRGSFTMLTGSAEILADGSARGRIEIDAASIDTKNAKRDKHLRSADFFDTAKHPQIVVDVTQAAARGSDRVEATGTLTVAGQTRPLTLTATITEATVQAITLRADADIDRADFGMRWNQLGMINGPAHVSVVARYVRTAAGQ
jgi:polyisoprenoid-binding protein YceI